jgi:hypothetical protein
MAEFSDLGASEQQKIRELGDELSRIPMFHAVPIYFGDMSVGPDEPRINNGTGSLVQIGTRKFCVTNSHVVKRYRTERETVPGITFHVGAPYWTYDRGESLWSHVGQAKGDGADLGRGRL